MSLSPQSASLDAPPADQAGRATALTVLTPMPRLWSGPVRLLLWIKRRLGPDRQLQQLSFIHVAHWAVLRSFPHQHRPNRYAYLLFVSNFNGAWKDYIDAFSTAVPRRMTLLWGGAFGFPGPLPPRPFVAYIRRNDLAPEHYFSAYPGASATEVASAIRVAAAVRELPVGGGRPAAEVAAGWRELLTRVQRDL